MACNKCGVDISKGVVGIMNDGVEVFRGDLCHVCFAQASEGAALLVCIFDAMIAAGISGEKANEVLTAAIEAHTLAKT